MSTETELKLHITPEQLARLNRHALLKSLSVSRPVTRRLHNIYYDTPKLELHKTGMALRLRRAGNQWLQTLKGGGSVEAGVHRRSEWEVPVGSAKLDFTFSGVEEWDEFLPAALRGKLRPMFVTDFSRSTRMLDFHGARIELCMDQGEVRADELSVPICEIELELKSGAVRSLFELASGLLDVVTFELEMVSKAERGYRLITGFQERPVKAMVPDLAETETLDGVFRNLAWSCMQHMQANLQGAMHSDDVEYLHQVRVALRRLRVVLRMMEKHRPDEKLSALYREVSRLCIALGRIREWDVFIEQTLQPICERMASHAGLQGLLSASRKKQQEGYAAMHSENRVRELQSLVLRFAIWMNGDYWQQQSVTTISVREFATTRLRRLAKRFRRSSEKLNTLDEARLHALRILAKKLRYSAEFFSSLFDKHNSKVFLAALGEVQDVLGQINDIAVAQRLMEELAHDRKLSREVEAFLLVKGWIEHDLTDFFAVMHRAVERVSKAPVFWK